MIFSYASRYLALVSLTTSSGMLTPSFPFSPDEVSQSRKYCCCTSMISAQSRGLGIPSTYLVVRLLRSADGVLLSGPEARRVGRENLVDEDEGVGVGVEAELELGVRDDDPAGEGVGMSLLVRRVSSPHNFLSQSRKSCNKAKERMLGRLTISYTRKLASSTLFATSSPTNSTARAREMFSSCSPCSAFVEGVQIGFSSFWLSWRPAGMGIPWTVPDLRYSDHAEPVM